MPNNYFQFKQFTIQQEHCAMKVCTDACLYGAWSARQVQISKANHLLDIGTGTGLLSLMAAQTNKIDIHAIEIDEAAAKQAAENFAASPWSNHLHVICNDVNNYQAPHSYDFIVTNPPFYDNDLKSQNTQRNTALHSADLTTSQLITVISRLLTADGKVAMLLPPHRVSMHEQLANKAGLFINIRVEVKQTDKHEPFRAMLLLGRDNHFYGKDEITIAADHGYTKEFVALLQDYYLYL